MIVLLTSSPSGLRDRLESDGFPKAAQHVAETVALVSLGEPRRFLLCLRGGGRSRAFSLSHGDLLVTGGKSQRAWEYSVTRPFGLDRASALPIDMDYKIVLPGMVKEDAHDKVAVGKAVELY